MPRSSDPDLRATIDVLAVDVAIDAAANVARAPVGAGHQIAAGARTPLSPAQKALSKRLDAVLPQTQCTRCGFPSCLDYAEALAAGETSLNRCPPGGAAGIKALADVLGEAPKPLDPTCGVEGPRLLAWIDPVACIGCTKCIVACPADAIIGGPKGMHTVLPALCTGCELCVAPCPVDCIELKPLALAAPWSETDAVAARERYVSRNARRQRELADDHRRFGEKAQTKLAELQAEQSHRPVEETGTGTTAALTQTERKRAIIAAAVERARLRGLARAAKVNSDEY